MPLAEVKPGVWNVSPGGMIYYVVTESEAAYIEGGPTHSSYVRKNHLSYIFFCKFFRDGNSTNQSAKADLRFI